MLNNIIESGEKIVLLKTPEFISLYQRLIDNGVVTHKGFENCPDWLVLDQVPRSETDTLLGAATGEFLLVGDGDGDGDDEGDRNVNLFGLNGTFGLSFRIAGFLVIIGFCVPRTIEVDANEPATDGLFLVNNTLADPARPPALFSA